MTPPSFTLVCVGRLKNRHLAALVDDYAARLRRSGSLELVELRDATVEREGERIREALAKRKPARVFALAEEGRTTSSATLAAKLDALEGRPAAFVIGGAYGLSPAVKKAADELLSLSPLTFPHEIARLLLCEQLYRAVSILSGSGYHHE
jgi:23S rRNA (pseudouridine1915-N3)-methyltransferase